MKIVRIAATIFVTLTLLIGSIAPAYAGVDARAGSLDEIALGHQELTENSVEDFSTTSFAANLENKESLILNNNLIDRNRIEKFSLTMPQLENRERNIIVYLPSDYQAGNNSYPVIYVLGAQDLFVQLDISSGDQVINESLYQFYTHPNEREAILVGIESDPIHMWDEYSPWVNRNMYLWKDPFDANEVEGGEGDAFLDFLVDTVKSVIDQRYRTLSDRENTSIAGSKMGGLLSLYAGLTMPEYFSRVMAMSPDVWFAEQGGAWLSNNHLLKMIEQIGVPNNVNFYLDVDAGDRVSDLVVKPAVVDAQGLKVSYPQTYLQGAQALISMLYQMGGSITSIGEGLNIPVELMTTTITRSNIPLGEVDVLLTYLPIIIKPVIPAVITSASWAIFTVSTQNSFTITTTGDPLPSIAVAGELPTGVSFVDNGDGTAIISGIPTAPHTYPLTITASNGLTPPVTQTFVLGVVQGCSTSGSCLLTFTVDMSPYLNRTRNISVYLPPNYQSGANYPVIYLMTAQYMFGAQIGVPLEDYNDWQIDETLDARYTTTGKGVIAVGIWYDNNFPYSEYSLTKNPNMDHWIRNTAPLNNPEGGKIIDFIRDKLKPEIDARFNTLTDRANTAIGGGSRGALLSLYAGLTAPETFSKVMAMSPAVWVAEGGPRIDFPAWPHWFSANGLQIWFYYNQAPTNVQYFLYIGTREVSTAENPTVYTPEGPQISWQAAYENGAFRVDYALGLEGVSRKTNLIYVRNEVDGVHFASIWRKYTDSVLNWFNY